ncbi:MAG: TolB family protein [Pyrinomonadaceae bacterium]
MLTFGEYIFIIAKSRQKALIELTKFPSAKLSSESRKYGNAKHGRRRRTVLTTKKSSRFLLVLALLTASCSSIIDRRDVRPLVLRDVPAQRLAYRFEPDIKVPDDVKVDDAGDKIEAIQIDFNTRRQNDALLRTVRSPDGQRALVLYGTEDQPSPAFSIDIYSSDGNFLRNLTPPDVSCVFPETVAWSPDGNFITFIAHRGVKPTPTPTPPGATLPEAPEASPLPSVAPAFPSVATYTTEQIYICNRDGYDLKPLTTREGLIYFYSSWAPDNHSLVALACRESEWDAREKEYKLPAGRPRLINLDGSERLLSDELSNALPAWSPDSSKVAAAFDADVMIYDAATTKPTQARIRLRDALIAASRVYEVKNSARDKTGDANASKAEPASQSSIPASFNPIVRLEWPTPEKLFLQTAYVRLLPNDSISTFQRWHLLFISPQAAALK